MVRVSQEFNAIQKLETQEAKVMVKANCLLRFNIALIKTSNNTQIKLNF